MKMSVIYNRRVRKVEMIDCVGLTLRRVEGKGIYASKRDHEETKKI